MGRGKKTEYGCTVPFRDLEYLLGEMEPGLAEDTGKRFCFVLGAGASIESGIPSGQHLVDQWDTYIRRRDSEQEYAAWKESMGIRSKQDQYAHYSDYYQKRFEEEPEEGPIFIRNKTARAEPSVGYLALASVMTETQNNIVITTNFDKLPETSIFRDTAQIPWVIGTASEIPYLQLNAEYPKILKVHGDMFLDMKNNTDEIKQLDERWKNPLKDVLRQYHPVFIGYAGNDPSLMGYLEEIADRIKRPYWLYFREAELTERIWRFVEKSNGCFVDGRIGFDAVLMHIFKSFQFEKAYKMQAEKRDETFQTKWAEAEETLKKLLAAETDNKMDKDTSDDDSIRESVRKITGNETPESMLYNLWNQPQTEQKKLLEAALNQFPANDYVLESYAIYWHEQGEPDEAEKYYKRAVEANPQNARNLGNYALFLELQRNDYDKAEEYYWRAVEADPKNAKQLGNYANFLCDQRKDYVRAEEYYQRSVEAGPQNATQLGNYAVFLEEQQKDYDKAEEYYRRAVEADPKHANNLGNYADFLWKQRKDYNKAEEYYRRAVKANPKDATNLGNYAVFLKNQRKDYDKAEEYYRRAVEADPKHANNLGNYANFLYDQRKDYDRAEEYYRRAVEADPKHATNLGNYANFLWKQRKNYDSAEEYYRRAVEADPKDANNLGNYANFLCDQRKDYDRAEEYYRRAVDADSNHANHLGNYANFLCDQRKDYDKAEEYYRRTVEADPKDANHLGNYAIFLKNQRKDYDKAEEYYRRALQIDPNHVNNLKNYAIFLKDIRHDAKAARKYRQRAEEQKAKE